jgi:hypothetical protein
MFLKRSRGEAKILRAMLFQIFMDSLRAFPPCLIRNYKNFFAVFVDRFQFAHFRKIKYLFRRLSLSADKYFL